MILLLLSFFKLWTMRLDMVLYSTEESDSIAADVNEQTLLKKKKPETPVCG